LLEATDTVKNKISQLTSPLKITISFADSDLTNAIPETLKLYYLDLTDNFWKPLESVVDITAKTVVANTYHLSQFAVFGSAIDNIYPETTLSTQENPDDNGWFSVAPHVVLSSNAQDLNKIFYSLDEGSTWEEYVAPVEIDKNGFTRFLYRSSDKSGNYETAKEQIFKVNFENRKVKTVSVLRASFSASP